MKRLLITLGLGLLLFLDGCAHKTTNVLNNDFEDTNQKPATVIHFSYREHDYIMFSWYCGGFDTNTKTGYVHDPDCRKCNKKKEENREL